MTRIDPEWPERRSHRLHVRIEPHVKLQIEAAAQEVGLTMSEFVIGAARERAGHVLARSAASSEELEGVISRLDEHQAGVLDRMAAAEGLSRAQVVRRLVDSALSGADDLEADLAAIDASFGAYQDIDVVPRETGEREEHLARMWQAAQ